MSEGTELTGSVTMLNGEEVDADDMHEPLSDEYYFIVPEKCTECKGHYEEEQCIAACPVPECLVTHPDHEESEDELLARKDYLHA